MELHYIPASDGGPQPVHLDQTRRAWPAAAAPRGISASDKGISQFILSLGSSDWSKPRSTEMLVS
jgi:hypothetical protein